MTEQEKLLLQYIYPKVKCILFDLPLKSLERVSNDSIKSATLALSIGLVPRKKKNIDEFIIELNNLIKINSISILYFRPHPLMQIPDIEFIIDLIKNRLGINMILDDLPLTSSLNRTNFLFTTISGIISEIDNKYHNQIYILSSLSSLQYSNVKIVYDFYPKLSLNCP
jgi:hypothetical protein